MSDHAYSTHLSQPARGTSAPNSRTQRQRILDLLLQARGREVPLPQIMAIAAQYNARIIELRRLGFNIQNRTEVQDGVRHSCYRLELGTSAVASKPTPKTTTPQPLALPLFGAALNQPAVTWRDPEMQ